MKRLLLLSICILSVFTSFAQTEKAKAMYAEATSGEVTAGQYLKQDFAQVDSATMHDLAVLFYQANDYISAGTCWEIALGKVKKHGKAYEQILNCLSAVYMETNDPQKIQWLLQVIEEHNQQELLKDCNDYKCKLERAQYYIMHGDEVKAKEHIKESLELCQTEYYDIIIKRINNGKERTVYEGNAQAYTDTDIRSNEKYRYTVTPYFTTDAGEKIYGKAIELPTVYTKRSGSEKDRSEDYGNWWETFCI